MKKRVTIIDYDMGNLWSIINAVEHLGHDAIVSRDAREVSRSSLLILPGVGSFRKAMMILKERGLDQAILEAITSRKSKILGICLGMQLLASYSTEDGLTEGLNLIPTGVEKFQQNRLGQLKIPHVGFNQVSWESELVMLSGFPPKADFYFVHSYRLLPKKLPGRVAYCWYGSNFLAAYEHENIFATQFHPEKSQTNGLKLMKNFLS